MSKSHFSTLIIAAMVALCVASVGQDQGSDGAPINRADTLSARAGLAASNLFWTTAGARAGIELAVRRADLAQAAERTLSPASSAAQAAGHAASALEMPFFSFGGATSSE